MAAIVIDGQLIQSQLELWPLTTIVNNGRSLPCQMDLE